MGSMGLAEGLPSNRFFALVIWRRPIRAHEHMGTVSAQGSTAWVLIGGVGTHVFKPFDQPCWSAPASIASDRGG